MENKLFQCTIEELNPLGRRVRLNFNRDSSDFDPYTAFNAPFADNYLAKEVEVESVVYPVTIMKQMKVVTLRVITNSYALRDLLNPAEIYFKTAGAGLDILPAEMGLHEVRVAIDSGNTEGLLFAGDVLNQNIARNHVVLETKGMTTAKQTALVDAFITIKTDNDTQETLRELRSSTAATDMIIYNEYWSTYVSPILDAGKLIYKNSNPTKARDYTASRLLATMRHDAAQTELHGLVTTADGKPVNKAKVQLIPVEGGRTKTVYTDAEGKYKMSGMKATDYNQVVSKGNLVKINPVTVVTREHIELNSVIV